MCAYIHTEMVCRKLLPHKKQFMQKSVGILLKAVGLCFVAFVLMTTIYTTGDVGVCS